MMSFCFEFRNAQRPHGAQGYLLEPQRIIPPLVASIVDGHQVGVIVPVEEVLPMQQQNGCR